MKGARSQAFRPQHIDPVDRQRVVLRERVVADGRDHLVGCVREVLICVVYISVKCYMICYICMYIIYVI